MNTTRAQHILLCLQEAEAGFYDLPRRMVRLVMACPTVVMPSLQMFRDWLDAHDLGQYVEKLSEAGSGTFMGSGVRIYLRLYQFTFPIRQIREVRSLGYRLTSLLSDEYPEYVQYKQLSSPSRPSMDIELFSYNPRLGRSAIDSLRGERNMRFWDTLPQPGQRRRGR